MVHLSVQESIIISRVLGMALVLQKRVLRLQGWATCQGSPADKPSRKLQVWGLQVWGHPRCSRLCRLAYLGAHWDVDR